MKNLSRAAYLSLFFCFFVLAAKSVDSQSLVINEIAWMGTKANSSDEWIELYNNTNQAISLEGWGLHEAGGETLIEPLTGIIEAKSYYLIERTDDTTVSDIPASQEPSSWGGYGLNNSGEHLQLLDKNSMIIDEVNCSGGWFAGESSPNYKTMERKDAQGSGSDPNNWATNNGSIINGKDSKDNPINGTPRAGNSISMAIELPTLPEEPPPQPKPQLEPELLPQEELSEEPTETEGEKEELESSNSSEETPQTEPKPIVYPSGIVINEILPSPEGPDEEKEWIEIFNQNSFEVDLSNWKIKDASGDVATFTFPPGTKISALSFLFFSRPTTKITLNNDGDGISLIQPDGKIIETINYPKAPLGQSYNRTDSQWSWSTQLTPGAKNIVPQPVSETKQPEPAENIVEEKGAVQPKKELAAIGEQATKKNYFVFLIALAIAVLSGVIILILKRKIKPS